MSGPDDQKYRELLEPFTVDANDSDRHFLRRELSEVWTEDSSPKLFDV